MLLAGGIAGQLLWFLAVYVLVVALTPVMFRWYRRYGWRVIGVLAVCALAVDVLRFEVSPAIGFLNALFVWLAAHQFGFHYADGSLRLRSGWASAGVAAVGFGITAAAVFFGPYPPSMIGMPGAPVSNMSPPTALMLSLTIGQLGLWLTLKPVITRCAERPRATAVLQWCGTRFMTLYLWHMPALVMTAGITVLGLGFATPKPGSPMWFAVAPLWVGISGIFLVTFTRIFGRFEIRRPSGAAGAVSDMSLGKVVLAAVLSMRRTSRACRTGIHFSRKPGHPGALGAAGARGAARRTGEERPEGRCRAGFPHRARPVGRAPGGRPGSLPAGHRLSAPSRAATAPRTRWPPQAVPALPRLMIRRLRPVAGPGRPNRR